MAVKETKAAEGSASPTSFGENPESGESSLKSGVAGPDNFERLRLAYTKHLEEVARVSRDQFWSNEAAAVTYRRALAEAVDAEQLKSAAEVYEETTQQAQRDASKSYDDASKEFLDVVQQAVVNARSNPALLYALGETLCQTAVRASSMGVGAATSSEA